MLAKALGEKSGKNDKEADRIALIRLVMFLSIFITNCFIVANAIRHWNDKPEIRLIIDRNDLQNNEEIKLLTSKVDL